MSFLSRVLASFRSSKRYAGRDLAGNKFYESPPSHNDCPKRTVEYRSEDDVWDYIGGRKRLPIQWSAWLAHTRPNPPTIEELESDMQRQLRVQYNASLIEARDREESEQLRRIQVEDRAEAMKAQVRGPVAGGNIEGESPVMTSDRVNPSPQGSQGLGGLDTQPKPTGNHPAEDPWAAAEAPVETEAWTPTLRRRRG